VFAWCGDASSWVRQHQSRNFPRIGVSVLTKHVELPIKRPIPRQAKRFWKSPKRTRNSPGSQRRSSLPRFPSNGSRSWYRSLDSSELSSRCVQVIVKSAASARGAEREGPRRICGCRPRGWVARAIPRLSLTYGEAPCLTGGAPSSGHERPARHPVRIQISGRLQAGDPEGHWVVRVPGPGHMHNGRGAVLFPVPC
jgi:hypothetical protein